MILKKSHDNNLFEILQDFTIFALKTKHLQSL